MNTLHPLVYRQEIRKKIRDGDTIWNDILLETPSAAIFFLQESCFEVKDAPKLLNFASNSKNSKIVRREIAKAAVKLKCSNVLRKLSILHFDYFYFIIDEISFNFKGYIEFIRFVILFCSNLGIRVYLIDRIFMSCPELIIRLQDDLVKSFSLYPIGNTSFIIENVLGDLNREKDFYVISLLSYGCDCIYAGNPFTWRIIHHSSHRLDPFILILISYILYNQRTFNRDYLSFLKFLDFSSSPLLKKLCGFTLMLLLVIDIPEDIKNEVSSFIDKLFGFALSNDFVEDVETTFNDIFEELQCFGLSGISSSFLASLKTQSSSLPFMSCFLHYFDYFNSKEIEMKLNCLSNLSNLLFFKRNSLDLFPFLVNLIDKESSTLIKRHLIVNVIPSLAVDDYSVGVCLRILEMCGNTEDYSTAVSVQGYHSLFKKQSRTWSSLYSKLQNWINSNKRFFPMEVAVVSTIRDLAKDGDDRIQKDLIPLLLAYQKFPKINISCKIMFVETINFLVERKVFTASTGITDSNLAWEVFLKSVYESIDSNSEIMEQMCYFFELVAIQCDPLGEEIFDKLLILSEKENETSEFVLLAISKFSTKLLEVNADKQMFFSRILARRNILHHHDLLLSFVEDEISSMPTTLVKGIGLGWKPKSATNDEIESSWSFLLDTNRSINALLSEYWKDNLKIPHTMRSAFGISSLYKSEYLLKSLDIPVSNIYSKILSTCLIDINVRDMENFKNHYMDPWIYFFKAFIGDYLKTKNLPELLDSFISQINNCISPLQKINIVLCTGGFLLSCVPFNIYALILKFSKFLQEIKITDPELKFVVELVVAQSLPHISTFDLNATIGIFETFGKSGYCLAYSFSWISSSQDDGLINLWKVSMFSVLELMDEECNEFLLEFSQNIWSNDIFNEVYQKCKGICGNNPKIIKGTREYMRMYELQNNNISSSYGDQCSSLIYGFVNYNNIDEYCIYLSERKPDDVSCILEMFGLIGLKLLKSGTPIVDYELLGKLLEVPRTFVPFSNCLKYFLDLSKTAGKLSKLVLILLSRYLIGVFPDQTEESGKLLTMNEPSDYSRFAKETFVRILFDNLGNTIEQDRLIISVFSNISKTLTLPAVNWNPILEAVCKENTDCLLSFIFRHALKSKSLVHFFLLKIFSFLEYDPEQVIVRGIPLLTSLVSDGNISLNKWKELIILMRNCGRDDLFLKTLVLHINDKVASTAGAIVKMFWRLDLENFFSIVYSSFIMNLAEEQRFVKRIPAFYGTAVCLGIEEFVSGCINNKPFLPFLLYQLFQMENTRMPLFEFGVDVWLNAAKGSNSSELILQVLEILMLTRNEFCLRYGLQIIGYLFDQRFEKVLHLSEWTSKFEFHNYDSLHGIPFTLTRYLKEECETKAVSKVIKLVLTLTRDLNLKKEFHVILAETIHWFRVFWPHEYEMSLSDEEEIQEFLLFKAKTHSWYSYI